MNGIVLLGSMMATLLLFVPGRCISIHICACELRFELRNVSPHRGRVEIFPMLNLSAPKGYQPKAKTSFLLPLVVHGCRCPFPQYDLGRLFVLEERHQPASLCFLVWLSLCDYFP